MVQSAVAVLGLSACAREAPSRLPGGVAGAGAPKKVVVIGAGLAGLSAARELVRAGHDVTVLEAVRVALDLACHHFGLWPCGPCGLGGRLMEVREDLADDGGVLESSDEAQPAAAARTGQHVEAEGCCLP